MRGDHPLKPCAQSCDAIPVRIIGPKDALVISVFWEFPNDPSVCNPEIQGKNEF
jgi:hypothetical protein